MSDVIRIDASVREVLQPVPVPGELAGGALSIRDAVESDIPFIDALQKANSTAVGFMPNAQLAGHIEKKHVLVAEQVNSVEGDPPVHCSLGTVHSPAPPAPPVPVGYCIGVDKYFKREDVGVIYQMNICPERRRGLVAAALLRAMFDRSAYGVKLYCCWCAQDLAANRFWEAMGFVPLAFRTGSRKKSWKGEDGARHKGPRTHIFWQKRIRQGDHETPWWFPSQTGSGAMREDRIVLPIPPGTHWSDAKPAVLPGVDVVFGEIAEERDAVLKTIGDAPAREAETPEQAAARKAERAAKRERANQERAEAAARAASAASGGLHFGPTPQEAVNSTSAAEKQKRKEAEKAAHKKVSKKNDPRLVAMARELRDRWQEHVAAQPRMIEGRRCGKYDVSRLLDRCDGDDAPAAELEVIEIDDPKRITRGNAA